MRTISYEQGKVAYVYFPNIQRLRRAKGYTQEEMAEMLGVTKRCYGAWERGERSFALENAWAIADVLDCTLDELAGREVPEPYEPDMPSERQRLLEAYDSLDDFDKEAAAASVMGIAAARNHEQRMTLVDLMMEGVVNAQAQEANRPKGPSGRYDRDDWSL